MTALIILSMFGAMFGWLPLAMGIFGARSSKEQMRSYIYCAQIPGTRNPEFYLGMARKERLSLYGFRMLVLSSAIAFFGGILVRNSTIDDSFGKYAVRSGVDGPIEVAENPLLVFPWEDKDVNRHYDDFLTDSTRQLKSTDGKTTTTVRAWVSGKVFDEQKFLARIHWGPERSWFPHDPVKKVIEVELNQFLLEHWTDITWCVGMADYCDEQYDRDSELLAYAKPYFEAFGISAEEARISFYDSPGNPHNY